jgi:hypothetical protein
MLKAAAVGGEAPPAEGIREAASVNRLRRNIWISLALGMASLISIVFCFLALVDVSHGESDLTLEWSVVRLSLAIIFIFIIFVITTLIRLLRAKGD